MVNFGQKKGDAFMDKLILQAHDLFKNCDFDYCICGGFALDMFAGKELRPHGDFDIVVFKENKKDAVKFLMDNGWPVYGRFGGPEQPVTQYLFHLIEDVTDNKWDDCENMWAVKPGSFAEMYSVDRIPGVYSYKINEPRLQGFDFIELAFDTREGSDFVLKDSPRITLPMEKAILHKDGVPYLAPEVVLFFKTDEASCNHPYLKPKTETDFKAIMPLLPEERKKWLLDAIETAYPNGHDWLGGLI